MIFADVVDVLGGQGLVYFVKEIGRVYKRAHFGTPIADFNGFRLKSAKSIEIRNLGTEVSAFIYSGRILTTLNATQI